MPHVTVNAPVFIATGTNVWALYHLLHLIAFFLGLSQLSGIKLQNRPH